MDVCMYVCMHEWVICFAGWAEEQRRGEDGCPVRVICVVRLCAGRGGQGGGRVLSSGTTAATTACSVATDNNKL
jgi:hypothetical protein